MSSSNSDSSDKASERAERATERAPDVPQPESIPPATHTEALAATRTDEAAVLRRGWTGADVFRAGIIVLAVWVAFHLLWSVYPLVFLVFLGTLFGLAVASGVDVLERFRIRRGIASALIVFSVVAALGATLAWTGPTLMEQSKELQTRVPAALEQLQDWVDQRRGGVLATVIKSAAAPAPATGAPVSPVPAPLPNPNTAAGKRAAAAQAQADSAAALPSTALKKKATDLMVGASKYLVAFLSNTVAILGGIVLLIFLSIYIGAEPEVYRGWILSVVPAQHRAQMRLVLGEMSLVLRKWLVTQMIAMVAIGLASMAVLLLLGVKAPYALAIIAGLMEFVPTIGPIISAVPAVLMAFTDSPQLAAYVAIAYWGIQFVENNLLIPFLMRGEMDLPPAITIVAQALMTLVFGFIGLMVAVPLTAAVLVPVRMFAIRENAREKQMIRAAHIARARAELDTGDPEEAIEEADKGPTGSSIRATRRGRVAKRSAELGNMTAEMAVPKAARRKANKEQA
ncbi:MAG: AI-2E family transporter [Gemmatimonas sp.]